MMYYIYSLEMHCYSFCFLYANMYYDCICILLHIIIGAKTMLLMMTGLPNKHANHHHRNHILQLLLVISETEGETEPDGEAVREDEKEREAVKEEEKVREAVKEEEKVREAVKEEEKEREAVKEEKEREAVKEEEKEEEVREEEEEVSEEAEEVREEEEEVREEEEVSEEEEEVREEAEEEEAPREGQTEGEEDRFNRFHLALKIGGIHQMSQILHHVNHYLDLLEILGLKLFQQNPTVLWSYFNCSFHRLFARP